MATFWTADWHLYHKMVIKYCNRPFKSIKEMHKALVINYNQTVRKDDTCYFCGDMAMIGPSMWEHLKGVVTQLNGRKHLIFGNHDELKWQRYLDVGFTSVHSAHWMKIDGLNIVVAHDPSVYCTLDPNTILICGHIHTLFKSLPEQLVFNAGVDVRNFRPVGIDELRKELGV